MRKIENLKKAIRTIAEQRSLLGDDVADSSIQALEKQISELRFHLPDLRKLVTVVFADLIQFTQLAEKIDPEEAHSILKLYFSPWKDAIKSYGGRIERFIGDGMLAVFGHPLSSEKDPENAIRAALRVRDGIDGLNKEIEDHFGICLSMRVGISTGTVLIGEVQNHGEVVVTGDAANLASRLQALAPVNGILISHDTYRHIRGIFDVYTKDPVSIKGKIEPVQTYLVAKAKPRAFPIMTQQFENLETRMIGRTEEFEYLRRSFDNLYTNGFFHKILITGEAGIGKSRLLYEFDTWAELQTEYYRIFKGRAHKHTQKIPYYLIRDIFAFRFQIDESDSLDIIQEKLENGFVKFMGEGHIEKAHFIGQLLGYNIASSPYIKGNINVPKQMHTIAIRYLTQFFASISEKRPIIIQLEDLHWADKESLEIINQISKNCENNPILMICCSRLNIFKEHSLKESKQDNQIKELNELNHKTQILSKSRHLTLLPLSNTQTESFILDILRYAKSEVPGEIISLVVDKSQGNPFYIEELIKMMIEEKIIVITDEGWNINIANLSNLHIPQTLFGILQARFDMLSPAEGDLLKRASIIGQSFWVGSLSYLLKQTKDTLSKDKIHQLLSQLQSKDLILKKANSIFNGDVEFCFKHALLHEVAYETVLKKLRTRYHHITAKWLIKKSGERVNEFSGLIALHFEKSDNSLESAGWYSNAGHQALRSFAPDTAEHYFRKSMDLMKDRLSKEKVSLDKKSEISLSIYEGLGDVMLSQIRYADALTAYSGMKKMSEKKGLIKKQVLALTKIALVQEMKSDYEASLETAFKAQKLIDQSNLGDIETEINVLIRICRAYLRLGKIEYANTLIQETLDKCIQGKNFDQLAQCYNVMGLVHEKFGRYEKASFNYGKALELYRQLGNKDWISGMLNNIAEMNRYIGRFKEAFSGFEEALNIAREIGDKLCETLYISNMGGVLFEMGEYSKAEKNLKKAISQVGQESSFFLPWTYAYLAKTYIQLSNIDAAASSVEKAMEMSDQDKNLEFLAFSWNVSGQIVAAGKPVFFKGKQYSATQCFKKSIQIFKEIGMEGEKAFVLMSWAEFELNRGNELKGTKLLQEAKDIYKKLGLIKRTKQVDYVMSTIN